MLPRPRRQSVEPQQLHALSAGAGVVQRKRSPQAQRRSVRFSRLDDTSDDEGQSDGPGDNSESEDLEGSSQGSAEEDDDDEEESPSEADSKGAARSAHQKRSTPRLASRPRTAAQRNALQTLTGRKAIMAAVLARPSRGAKPVERFGYSSAGASSGAGAEVDSVMVVDGEEGEGEVLTPLRPSRVSSKRAAVSVHHAAPVPTALGLDLQWLGPPTRMDAATHTSPARTHYAAFRLRGVTFAVGDHVEVLSERPDAQGKMSAQKLYPARVLDAWQPAGHDALAAGVQVAWYLFSSETHGVLPPSLAATLTDRDVFPTSDTGAVPMAALNQRADVLSCEQWEERRGRRMRARLERTEREKRRVLDRSSGGACAGVGGKRPRQEGEQCDESDGADTDHTAESEARVHLPQDDDLGPRVVALYIARFAYDRGTRQYSAWDCVARMSECREEARWNLGRTGRKGAAQAKKGNRKADASPLSLPPSSFLPPRPCIGTGTGMSSGSGVMLGGGGRPSLKQAAVPASPSASGPDSVFRATCAQLQLSAVPDSLPCREKERAQLADLLSSALTAAAGGGGGQALYVAGMPGTGKTATVCEVVRTIQAASARGELPHFTYVEVNAMKLASPYAMYSALYRAMTGQAASPAKACALLEARFAGRSTAGAGAGSSGQPKRGQSTMPAVSRSVSAGRTVLLVVDELDYCVTRKQSVLYNLFDWPLAPGSGLVVLGIANTMDMPERLLPRVASRLGMGRVSFTPYTSAQIETIVSARLSSLPHGVFDPAAITLASKKVAVVSGDVRRALAMCRRAVDLARDRGAGAPSPFRVTLDDVKRAASELASDLHTLRMTSACAVEKLLLLALAVHMRAHGGEGALLCTVHEKAEAIVRVHCVGGEGGGAGADLSWDEIDRLCMGGNGAGTSSEQARILRLLYPSCPSLRNFEDAAYSLAAARILVVDPLTPAGAAVALSSGTLTGGARAAAGAGLAGVYPACKLAVALDDVALALRGEVLTGKLVAAGQL